MSGHDPMDATSIDAPVPPVVEAARNGDVAGLRIGIVSEFAGDGYQPGVMTRFTEAVELLESLGAKVTEISCPHFKYALPAYYLLAPSEASSNLARFDGMRYGLRTGGGSAEEVMAASRAAGFGEAPVEPASRRGSATLTPMATITAIAAAIGMNAFIRRGRGADPALSRGEVFWRVRG